MEVVAGSADVAKQVAAEEWGVPEERLAGATVTPLRPYKEGETTQQPAAQQPSTQFGAARGAPNYAIVRDSDGTVVHRFYADNRSDAIGQKYDFVRMQGWNSDEYSLQDESESTPVPGSTLDLARRRAAATQQGNWGIWIDGASRFAREPGEYPGQQEIPLRRFPSREAAEQWIEQQRAERPGIRTDIEVREIEPSQPAAPDEFTSTQNVPREGQPRNLVPTGPGPWEIYRISNGESVRRLEHTNRAAAEEEARSALGLRGEAPELYGVRTQQSTLAATGGDAAQVGIINTANEPTTGSQVGQTYNPSGTGSFTGQWLILDPNNQVIYRFGGIGNSQSDANRIAMNWLTQNPRQMVDGVTVVPEMG